MNSSTATIEQTMPAGTKPGMLGLSLGLEGCDLGLGTGLDTSGLGLGLEPAGLVNIPV